MLLDRLSTTTIPEIVWATIPHLDGSALGAIVFPQLPQNSSLLLACTLDARMAPGSLQGTRDVPLIVTGADHHSIYDEKNPFPRISIDPAWAAYPNPTILSDDSTAFQDVLKAAGLWGTGSLIDSNHTIAIVESLLALTIVNGLGRQDFGVGLLGMLLGNADGLDLVSNHDAVDMADETLLCNGWCKQLLPSVDYAMSFSGNAFNISDQDKAIGTKLTMQAHAQGWAYSASGSAAKFALIALLLNTLIAASHWIYSIKDKKTPSSWDTISELVVLAMSSNKSEALVHTGAGIYSAAMFKKLT